MTNRRCILCLKCCESFTSIIVHIRILFIPYIDFIDLDINTCLLINSLGNVKECSYILNSLIDATFLLDNIICNFNIHSNYFVTFDNRFDFKTIRNIYFFSKATIHLHVSCVQFFNSNKSTLSIRT